MNKLVRRVLFVSLWSACTFGADFTSLFPLSRTLPQSRETRVSEIKIATRNWQLAQEAKSESTYLFGFKRGDVYLHFFAKPEDSGFEPALADRAVVLAESESLSRSGLLWNLSLVRSDFGSQSTFTVFFETRRNGWHYFGYIAGNQSDSLERLANDFVAGIDIVPGQRSLTGDDYYGKKYYVGFGDYLSGFMGNEVKYDISHTHNIFTNEVGGKYIGTKLVGSGIGRTQLLEYWAKTKDAMTWNDMYVQYSSGHGHESGLAFGVSYNEIRDYALSLPAKEVIIFIMACHSGGLVESFKQKKDVWSGWGGMGRTLFVLASSKHQELSSTGPGTDADEPGGPSGSAGSAFGHALWKSLIGYSDGFKGGVKDGFISLDEIREYTTYRTYQLAQHTPVSDGVYQGNLIMNRVPPKKFLAALEGSTEGLSDEQIMRLIQDLDSETRIR